MANTTKNEEAAPAVEGEGSYTATRRYNENLKASPGAARSEELAEEAKEALEGPEGDELRRAEQEAKRGPKPS